MTTVSAQESLWIDTAARTDYPSLAGELQVDVAVVGGGVAGLTVALLLKRNGARVAVIEADRVGHGVTGCTTAKVTALQQTLLTSVHSHQGEAGAAVYAQASLAGVEKLAAIVAEEGIDCDLERRPAATYAASADQTKAVEQEFDVARAAGLQVEWTNELDLPYPVAGAVRLDDQVQIQPVKYAQGLARAIDGDGSAIFERSRVLSVEDRKPCRVKTEAGVVTASQTVIATHYPLLDRGVFFARLEPVRSYCVAAPVRGSGPYEMAISAGSNARSLRSYEGYLVVGGEGHPAGSAASSPERYDRLAAFAREHWDTGEITHRWSAHDPEPYDLLPIVGPYSPRSSTLYVTSGFQKWGFTSATFAAMLLSEQIGGGSHPWADRFAPNRATLRSAPRLARMNAKVGLDFVGDRLRPAQAGSAQEVPRGEAKVVRDGPGKTGVYRDEDGGLHAVSLRCTHLGCLLRFNSAERSWDCPCHGSRFDVDGEVLEGPAVRPLERRKAP